VCLDQAHPLSLTLRKVAPMPLDLLIALAPTFALVALWVLDRISGA
jgi:hypothetical protein